MQPGRDEQLPKADSLIGSIIRFCLLNKTVVGFITLGIMGWGLIVAPFNLPFSEKLVRDPVPVDAIPDIGENQQIVFTRWQGRSPQDVRPDNLPPDHRSARPAGRKNGAQLLHVRILFHLYYF